MTSRSSSRRGSPIGGLPRTIDRYPMIKKDIFGDDLKEQLVAASKDKLYRFTLVGGTIRGAFLHATRMVREMRANHETGPLETLILGQAYIAAGLLMVHMKDGDRTIIQVQCNGPVKGLRAESNSFGEVRGFLSSNPIPLPEDADTIPPITELFGIGGLSVTKHLSGGDTPFTGTVDLAYGTLAEDLAYYFVTSEQTPAAFDLSIEFDTQGKIVGAGGLFLGVLPSAERFESDAPVSDSTIRAVESAFLKKDSIGDALANGEEPSDCLTDWFADMDLRILDDKRVAFMCHCSKAGFEKFLAAMDLTELEEIAENGPFPLITTCHNCNTSYSFSQESIQLLYRKRKNPERFT